MQLGISARLDLSFRTTLSEYSGNHRLTKYPHFPHIRAVIASPNENLHGGSRAKIASLRIAASRFGIRMRNRAKLISCVTFHRD